MQFALELQAFGGAFLDDVGAGDRGVQIGMERQAVQAGTGRQALGLQRRPGIGQAGAQGGFGARRRIPGADLQAPGQGPGGPAGAG